MAGAIYAAVLYYRERQFRDDRLRIWVMAMAAFRFVLVSLLFLLLLAPFLRSKTTDEIKPIIVYLQDDSESIRMGTDSAELDRYLSSMESLLDDLSDDYTVERYAFGEQLEAASEFGFERKATDISGVLSDVADRFYNKNMGALILSTDGIFNQGSNPLYGKRDNNYPMFVVPLGDTSTRRDLKVDEVKYNKIAYLGDLFAVEAGVRADNLAGTSTELVVYHNKSGIGRVEKFREEISLDGDAYLETFELSLEADEAGIQHFIAELRPVAGEYTRVNNRFDFYVDVLDGRKKVLLLAEAPHPDISAIRRSLKKTDNYELELAYADRLPASFDEFNLVILHSLPSYNGKMSGALRELGEGTVPLLYILGSETDINRFNKMQGVFSIERSNAGLNDVGASFEGDFDLYKLPEEIMGAFSAFPPVFAPFGDYELKGNTKVLMYQRIGSVESGYPLLAFNETVNRKLGVFAGDGLWRWRMYNYLNNENFDHFDEWFNQVVQYLSIRTDKRPFKVFPEKNRFSENESVRFNAQLYNSNFEAVNDPDVQLRLTDQEGNEYDYVFERRGDAYFIDVGFLPVGAYRFHGSTKFGGKDLSAGGSFSVSPIQLESLETRADHNLLSLLASQSGGRMVGTDQLAEIAEAINAREDIATLLFDSYQTSSVIHLKWIFFLLLALLSLEWFLRKYHGGY